MAKECEPTFGDFASLHPRAEENKLLLLNAMGEDKKGKMSSITARVLAHGGSLEDSKMSRMEGEFGVLLKIRIPEANSRSLVAELSEHEGLQVKQ
jgi:glycine cleavage system regulatory protein